MTRNRRNSTSMKFAVGQGCFLLLVGVLCVGFSVTKIIVGSEYVNRCPSREMIPVYVIVSGCLPVLLSALRQPYISGQPSEKERWSMKITLFTAVVGVMVNLAWLVAGTYLVVTTWSGIICNTIPKRSVTSLHPEILTTPATNRNVETNYHNTHGDLLQSSTDFPTANVNAVTLQVDKNLDNSLDQIDGENKERQNINETEKKIMESMKLINSTVDEIRALQAIPDEQTDVDGAEKDPAVNEKEVNLEIDDDSLDDLDINKTVDDETNQIQDKGRDILTDNAVSKAASKVTDEYASTKRTAGVEKSGNKLAIKDIIIQNILSDVNDYSQFTTASSQDTLCITCDIHILRFSVAVVVIDWIFVIFGIIYFCHFVYYRFLSIKDQILLINA